MKKILFYTSFITAGGGLQKVSVEYLQILINKGYQVDFISDFNMGKDIETLESLIPKEVNFQYLKSAGVSKFIYYFRTLGKRNKLFNLLLYMLMICFDFYYYHTKMKYILKRGNYDFSITFYQFLPSYLTREKSIKHIIWLHGSVEHFFGGIKNLFKKSYEYKLQKYDYIVTIADEMKEQLENFYPNLQKGKIKRIYNPFNFDNVIKEANNYESLSVQEQKLLGDDFISTVARIDEGQKDIATLINAYEILYKQNKIKEKLYIIGDGPSKENLENLVSFKDLEKQILFLGNKSNPYIWMKNTKLFILSSKFEGFGLVLVEAMTCKTFVISSNCKTGPKEILKNGECGDLFEVGNAKELAQKIKFALNHEEYRSIKICKAFERISEFNELAVMEQLFSLLEYKK